MKLGIEGRKALVTASGRGIGRAIVKALAAEGANVAFFSRTKRNVDSLLEEIGGEAAGHYGVALDATPEGAPTKFARDVTREFGPIDIAVHNLGDALGITDPFCSLDDWRRVYRTNLEVAIELNSALVPHMRARGWGRVVHVGSTASLENNGPITYCSAKAALAAYSRSLGRVLAAEGVVVTCVLPGVVLTEGGHWEQVMRERPEHAEQYLATRCPANRMASPEEIAPMVLLLCSELATFCQAAIVPVDGGQIRSYLI